MAKQCRQQKTYLLGKVAAKGTLPLGTKVPLPVNDAEANIFVRRPARESDETGIEHTGRRRGGRRGVAVAGTRSTLLLALDPVRRRLGPVDEVGIEEIELVPLRHLWRWVIVVEVGLVVLVPLVPHHDAVEVPRFPGPVLIRPPGPDRVPVFGVQHFLVVVGPAGRGCGSGGGGRRRRFGRAGAGASVGEGEPGRARRSSVKLGPFPSRFGHRCRQLLVKFAISLVLGPGRDVTQVPEISSLM